MSALKRTYAPVSCCILLLTALLPHGHSEPSAVPEDDDPTKFFEAMEKEKTPPVNEVSKPSVPLPLPALEAIEKLRGIEEKSAKALAGVIAERRKVLITKLRSMAEKAAPELRKEIEGKISRVEEAPLDKDIAHPGWSPNPALDRLMGEWFFPNKDHFILERDGKVMSSGKQRGVWSWLDSELGVISIDFYGSAFIDMIRLDPAAKDQCEVNNNYESAFRIERRYDCNIDANHYRYPLAQAAYYEGQLRKAQQGEVGKQRRETAAVLLAQAKALTGPVAEAVKLEAAKALTGKSRRMEKAERAGGKWQAKDGRVWEFLPDGSISRNGEVIQGRWTWAKVANWSTMLVRTTTGEPGAEKSLDIFYARVSGKDPNVLRINGLGTQLGDFARK